MYKSKNAESLEAVTHTQANLNNNKIKNNISKNNILCVI